MSDKKTSSVITFDEIYDAISDSEVVIASSENGNMQILASGFGSLAVRINNVDYRNLSIQQAVDLYNGAVEEQ